MKRDILIWPDSKLTKPSEEVTSFDKELHTLLDDMKETLLGVNGLGLAAPQVGINKKVFIITLPDQSSLEVINPKFNLAAGPRKFENEGCLSLPGERFQTLRYSRIGFTFKNRNGESKEYYTEDPLTATEIQHEMDHLNGKLLISDLSTLKKDIIKRRMLKYKKYQELVKNASKK